MIEAEDRRAIGTINFVGIPHVNINVRMILRWLGTNTLELTAANAHDWRSDLVMKLGITVHIHRADEGFDSIMSCIPYW